MSNEKENEMNEVQSTDVGELIKNMDSGFLQEKLGLALSEAALGIMHNGGKAKIGLELEISQIGDTSQIYIKHNLKVQKPTKRGHVIETDLTATPFFVNANGDVSIFPRKGVAQFPGQSGPLFAAEAVDKNTGEVKDS